MLTTVSSKLNYINKACAWRLFSISSSSRCREDQHWRKLKQNPNNFGPLTNLPDYTFMDGRPSPLGANLKKRLDKQKEIAEKIVVLSKELDFAKERHAKIQQQKLDDLEHRKKRQLKAKGHLLNKTT